MPEIRLICGDCIDVMSGMESGSVHTCVTSPPYWGLRDYGVEGQIGLEPTPEEYVTRMVEVFREVRRVLRDDGTLWLNMGDSYANSQSEIDNIKPKDLVGMPWRVAFALRADGWYLRSDIIWHKPNPMPESVTDRPTKSHEYIFLMSKAERYYYDAVAISERSIRAGEMKKMGEKSLSRGQADGSSMPRSGNALVDFVKVTERRNKRSVWTVATHPYNGAHFATFPPKLIEPCILAGTSEDGCCPSCLAPRIRDVEKSRQPTRSGNSSKIYVDPVGSPYESHDGSIVGNRDPFRHCTSTTTVGWKSDCDCRAASPVPCTVLDPFSGAGTTGFVCLDKGRDYVGIELSPKYHAMAEERIADYRAETPLLELMGN